MLFYNQQSSGKFFEKLWKNQINLIRVFRGDHVSNKIFFQQNIDKANEEAL